MIYTVEIPHRRLQLKVISVPEIDYAQLTKEMLFL